MYSITISLLLSLIIVLLLLFLKMIIIICKMKNVSRICSNRVIRVILHLIIVEMIVCFISRFQLLTPGKSIYKISKHFSFIHVLLVLVENVFILIKVFIRISSSFYNCFWLIWMHLMEGGPLYLQCFWELQTSFDSSSLF